MACLVPPELFDIAFRSLRAILDSSGGAVEFNVEVGETEKAEIMDEGREDPTGARPGRAR